MLRVSVISPCRQYLRHRIWLIGLAADLGGALLMILAFALAPVSIRPELQMQMPAKSSTKVCVILPHLSLCYASEA